MSEWNCPNTTPQAASWDRKEVTPTHLRPVVKSLRCLSEYYESNPQELEGLRWNDVEPQEMDIFLADSVVCRCAGGDGWLRLYAVYVGTNNRHPVRILRIGATSSGPVIEVASILG